MPRFPSVARIVVGMSGGVDSSLAAALLAEQGEEVVGLTMKLWPCAEEDGGFVREDACCSPRETVDARAVAVSLGLPHYVVDLEEEFRRGVVDGFLAGYARGETPNPCVRCNEQIKFGDLIRQAGRVGADAVATGHYARVVEVDGRRCLGVSADRGKDQTYFLFSLSQEQLARASFPLGERTKDVVRGMAADRGLATAAKLESQDICFVGHDGVAAFLRREIPDAFRPGEIRHVDGRVLGEHRGLAAYTIGQRKGLGLAWHEPLFVVDLHLEANAVVVGEREHLLVDRAELRDCTWHLGPPPPEGLRVRIRNRYRGAAIEAEIVPRGERGAEVRYAEACTRPSPGQAGVCYDLAERLCLGGGWFTSRPYPKSADR